jgi:DNA invertase Pin-like site-specific DNA recombinase
MKDQSTTPPPARRTAVYLRTGPLAEMIESDLEPLQAYAAERGYQIVDVYRDEGKSGRDRKRTGLARMRADAAQGRFDVLLVAHHKRLAATEVDAQAIIEELEGHGVTVDSLAGDLPLIPR